MEIVFDNDFLFDLTLNLKSKLQVDFSNKEGPDKYHQRFIETMEKEENGDYDYIYKNVACFLNNLSKGPIACGIGSEERTTFLKQMPVIEYFENPTSFKSDSLDDHKLIRLSGEQQAQLEYSSLEKIKLLITEYSEIRIWYDKNPDSIMGFCYLCSLLESYTGKIYVMNISMARGFGFSEESEYESWDRSDLFDEDGSAFRRLLDVKKELSDSDRSKHAQMWKTVEKENTNERIVIFKDNDFSIVSK